MLNQTDIDILRQINFFNGFRDEQLKRLAEVAQVAEFSRGAIILRARAGERVYFGVSGDDSLVRDGRCADAPEKHCHPGR